LLVVVVANLMVTAVAVVAQAVCLQPLILRLKAANLTQSLLAQAVELAPLVITQQH
jgi:hypothetical protein